MAMKYVSAYLNESTNDDWQFLNRYDTLLQAQNHINEILPQMTKSAIAIFVETETVSWRQRPPRYLYNRHILYGDRPFGSVLSGLINSKGSDWF
jgi:hypothetical protein